MQILRGVTMLEKKYYCEGDYSRVTALSFKGKAYHITISGGNAFKPVGTQTDGDYRRLFTAIGKLCEEQTKKLDVNNYGGFRFVLCGGTSFIHGSSKVKNEELGKPHLHMILYTNCNALAGNEFTDSRGYKYCKGGLIEKWLLEEKDGFQGGIRVSPFVTAETIDYALQQRVEPEPELCGNMQRVYLKSLLKTIVEQYPKGKNYKANLRKWDRNITASVKKILEANTVSCNAVAPLANPIRLRLMGRGGVIEGQLLQKAFTLANTRHRHKQALRLEITGLVASFEEWLKEQPLIAHYLFRTYWNNSLVDKVNEVAGEPVLSKLVTYTRNKGNGEKVECWTRTKIKGSTKDGIALKADGWTV